MASKLSIFIIALFLLTTLTSEKNVAIPNAAYFKIQSSLRFECLESGNYAFDVAELKNAPFSWTVCIEGRTDAGRCKENPKLSTHWEHYIDAGNSITLLKVEHGNVRHGIYNTGSTGASGETMIDRANKLDGWQGNNLEWYDIKRDFKITVNVRKL